MRKSGQNRAARTIKYVHWRSGNMWVGYLQDFPDYLSQGETVKELQANLKDLYADLSGGHIPGPPKVSKLRIA